mmetsp:Transcript_17437/g.49777  ORF Transcript_17437/g.49777 Transcript_17437/m.49777 type:complete len:351 (-) Transcript_17437:359-1411(-)
MSGHGSYLLLQSCIIKKRRADLLRDAAGLAVLDVRLPYLIQQLRLSRINVTHDTTDRRPQTTLASIIIPTLLPRQPLLAALELLQLGLPLRAIRLRGGLGLELRAGLLLLPGLAFPLLELAAGFFELLGLGLRLELGLVFHFFVDGLALVRELLEVRADVAGLPVVHRLPVVDGLLGRGLRLRLGLGLGLGLRFRRLLHDLLLLPFELGLRRLRVRTDHARREHGGPSTFGSESSLALFFGFISAVLPGLLARRGLARELLLALPFFLVQLALLGFFLGADLVLGRLLLGRELLLGGFLFGQARGDLGASLRLLLFFWSIIAFLRRRLLAFFLLLLVVLFWCWGVATHRC